MDRNTALLDVEALTCSRGATPIVRAVSFALERGESLALVGESGSGKTTIALALLGLLDGGWSVSGQMRFDGLSAPVDSSTLHRLRGAHIGMVFQEPMSALNPVLRIGDQVAEVLVAHKRLRRRPARERALELLRRVELPSAEQLFCQYPHQLSGGMRQRVMLAIALAAEPQLLIADEPTTALDAIAQDQTLRMLQHLQQQLGLAVLLITHDVVVVRRLCQRMLVLYGGEVVEHGPVSQVLKEPAHPYTRELIQSVAGPLADCGPIPAPAVGGCHFASRCPAVREDCRHAAVALALAAGRGVRCLHPLVTTDSPR